jgi:hypothetical protein
MLGSVDWDLALRDLEFAGGELVRVEVRNTYPGLLLRRAYGYCHDKICGDGHR